ncbi:MAG TPA: DUF922 domain-containing protein [Vicinamibacterales bacterium]|nr:DUF922 domain-containing protein [Vicinamibacterales bacterium]
MPPLGAVRAVLLPVVVVMTAACAGTRQPSAPPGSLDARLDADEAAAGAVPWAADRPLVWSDFRAQAPAGGPEGALTAYSLLQDVRCTGTAFEFRVTAAFLPQRSWVKPPVLANPALSARTLRHEQTHFDLTEVHARLMRQYFAELYEPCRQDEAVLQRAADRFVADEAAEQSRYDADTHHGLAAPAQTRWDEDVRQRLAELRRWVSGEDAKRARS